jgi:DNA-binding MarR family transcriptional regulator
MVGSRQVLKKTAGQQSQAQRFMAAIEGVIDREVRPADKEVIDAMLDFSPPEMRSLMVLGRLGKTVMSDFAKGVGVPLSTATRIANRLVKKGIVVRHRSDTDRRIVEVDLSPIGYEYKAKFHAKRLKLTQKLLAPLSDEERETLLFLMERALRLSAAAKKS